MTEDRVDFRGYIFMARYAQILSTGSYVPERVVTNAEVDALIGESTDQWLIDNVGIRERHWMSPEQTTSDLIVAASQTALDRAGGTIWLLPRGAAHPPPGNLPPVAVRGVVLVPSEHVDALDEATGAPLGAAAAVAPVRLLVDSDLSLHALDGEGLLTVLRLATHLSVV